MAQDFRKFGMNVVGISETKWFGHNVYDVDGFLILASGRPVPRTGEKVQTNNRVGTVLDPSMVSCWKDGSEVWNESCQFSHCVCKIETW